MVRHLASLAVVAALAFGAGYWTGRDGASSGSTASVEAPREERAAEADLSGPLRVIDGDTFDVGGTRVRLHGVDAPEDAQSCLDEAGAPWACGDWTTAEARARWEGREALCEVVETDRYGRAVSRCAVAGEDIGATLVGQGMALAYVAYSEDYLPEQARAEAADLGLWRGTFQAPWDWRRAPEDLPVTEVEAVAAEEGDCAIKGNISGSGRIYHLPGSATYERTRIDEAAGERWFCTAAEAEAAGWRAAR